LKKKNNGQEVEGSFHIRKFGDCSINLKTFLRKQKILSPFFPIQFITFMPKGCLRH